MNLNKFLPSESVLLVGEGNFSFTVGLKKLVPFVKITTTCFEPAVDLQADGRKFQNIEKLKQIVLNELGTFPGVRVLLGVDGTKLPLHPTLGHEQFSKIIFNFPHVGGKMKISLNRKLLKDLFENVSGVLAPGGQVLISLCKGQGGTKADEPSRCWGNSWQVVEMAAHGDFVLSAVEKFPSSLFPDYSSVGYRSRDLAFHTEDALVHVFRKAEPLSSMVDLDSMMQSIDLERLVTVHGDIVCDSIYAQKYRSNPLCKEGSPIHYLHESLKLMPLAELGTSKFVKHISDYDIPLHVENPSGRFTCHRDGDEFPCELRSSLLDVADKVTPLLHASKSEKTLVFSGLVFNRLGHDFSCPPVSNHLLVIGRNDVEDPCKRYVAHLLSCTKNVNTACAGIPSEDAIDARTHATLVRDLVLQSEEPNQRDYLIGRIYLVKAALPSPDLSACVIYLDKLAQHLFRAETWRQLWAVGAGVVDGAFALASLYPQAFALDICFSNVSPYDEQVFVRALWQVAADIVAKLSPSFNAFVSVEGWESRCYSITYMSFDGALFKVRARDVHLSVGRAVCAKLGFKLH